MAKCTFCEQKLPEPGFTHYMLVESLKMARPCCAACRKRLNLKMIDLRKGES